MRYKKGKTDLDIHDRETRSKNMKAIKSRDTKPEIMVRKLLHQNGYRFRIAPAKLPGKPDIWMAKWNTAVFVHGCFWHMHNCKMFKLPKTRAEQWKEKLSQNVLRDKQKIKELTTKGTRVLVIWECSLRGKGKLSKSMLLTLIKTFLISDFQHAEINTTGLEFIY